MYFIFFQQKCAFENALNTQPFEQKYMCAFENVLNTQPFVSIFECDFFRERFLNFSPLSLPLFPVSSTHRIWPKMNFIFFQQKYMCEFENVLNTQTFVSLDRPSLLKRPPKCLFLDFFADLDPARKRLYTILDSRVYAFHTHTQKKLYITYDDGEKKMCV